MDEVVAQLCEQYRKDIISYVYRLTGSIEEAKDITQETIIKFLNHKGDDIKNTKAWMFKVATNLSLDFFKSSKNTKEMYIGPWLPEPYLEESKYIDNELEIDESLSMALLVLMEKLSKKERITYILHDIFEFKHKEIALILDTTAQNSRQLNSRANKKLQNKNKKFNPTKEEHEKLTNSFLKAIKEGDFEELKSIFTEDVTLISDGGGKAIAARKILYGDDNFISKFLIKVTQHLFSSTQTNAKIETIWFNGSLGIIIKENGRTITSYNFEVKDNKIACIYVLRNPDKLKHFI